jgi:energy-coupling factor transport system substrate-specific component
MTATADSRLGPGTGGEAHPVVPLRLRSAAVLTVASVAGLLMFLWPLLVRVRVDGDVVQPPFVFALLLPVVIVVCLAEFTEGGMDSKVLAMLGVLTAINAVMRGLSAGMAGIELVFFLLILGGRVFGAGFGFVLGCTSLFASAWVGMGAGLLPRRVTGRREIAMLVVYGIVAAYAFGLVMNMSSWPFTLGIEVPGHTGGLSFVPGDPLVENLHRFAIYTLLTSTGSWDTGRAITNTIALVVLGPAVLTTLRRAVRRATVTRH